MSYKIFIEPEVFDEIQETIHWYNNQKKGLGKEFYNTILNFYKILKIHPLYRIRYNKVRCLPN